MSGYSLEFKEQIKQAYQEIKSSKKVSKQFNIGENTVVRWCRDIIKEEKENKEVLIQKMRDLYLQNLSVVEICRQLSVNEKLIYHHCHDLIKMKQEAKSSLREQSRELYKQGFSYNQIQAKLNISKSTISKHCSDLADTRNIQAKSLRKKQHPQEKIDQVTKMVVEGFSVSIIVQTLGVNSKFVYRWCGDLLRERRKNNIVLIKSPRKSTRNVHRLLALDDVVTMRREVRKSGVRHLSKWAKQYNVCATTISWALSGKTYKEADTIEPPITENLPFYRENLPKSRFSLSQDLKNQVIEKRKTNPYNWSYKALAEWLQEQTGKKYKETHVAKILFSHDPSLKDLEKFDAPKPSKIKESKPRFIKPKKEKKDLHPAIKAAMLKARRDRERQKREEFRKFLEMEEQRERAIKSLLQKGYSLEDVITN